MLFQRTPALSLLSRAGGTTLPRGGPTLSRARGTLLPSNAGTKLPGSNQKLYASVADPTLRAALRSLIQETTTSPTYAPAAKIAGAGDSSAATASGSTIPPPAVATVTPAKEMPQPKEKETPLQSDEVEGAAADFSTPATKNRNEPTASPSGAPAVIVSGVRRSLAIPMGTNSTDASGAVVAEAPAKAPPIVGDDAPAPKDDETPSAPLAKPKVSPAKASPSTDSMVSFVKNQLGRGTGTGPPAAPEKPAGKGGKRSALAVVTFSEDKKSFQIVSNSMYKYSQTPEKMTLTTTEGKSISPAKMKKIRGSVKKARLNGRSVHLALVSKAKMEKLKSSATLGAESGVYTFA